jgi:hypothetical protein
MVRWLPKSGIDDAQAIDLYVAGGDAMWKWRACC